MRRLVRADFLSLAPRFVVLRSEMHETRMSKTYTRCGKLKDLLAERIAPILIFKSSCESVGIVLINC